MPHRSTVPDKSINSVELCFSEHVPQGPAGDALALALALSLALARWRAAGPSRRCPSEASTPAARTLARTLALSLTLALTLTLALPLALPLNLPLPLPRQALPARSAGPSHAALGRAGQDEPQVGRTLLLRLGPG